MDHMNNPKISVIIPVYNVEKYLAQCLDSVVNQTFKDIEIICVNDGSTDGSLNILQKYASNDDRIIIINKENRGVSAARNDGLERVAGDYIMFLDADDYYFPETCEKAYKFMATSNVDIGIFGNYILEHNELKKGWTSLKIEEIVTSKIQHNYFECQIYCWDKIYRAAYLRYFKFRFVENLTTAEDVLFCLNIYFTSPCYGIVNEALYVYRLHSSSLTHSENCIASDFKSFRVLHSQKIFRFQSLQTQLHVVEKFCNASLVYLNNTNNYKKSYADAKQFLKFLSDNYPVSLLWHLKSYKYLKLYNIKRLLKLIFSIRNSVDKVNKIITICGFYIVIKRRIA